MALAIRWNRPWLKEVRRCQKEILSCDPHPHYARAYREQEAYYWMHVPKWLMELRAAGIKVTNVLDIGCAYGTLALFTKRIFDCGIYCTDFTAAFLSPRLAERHAFNFAVNNIERDAFPWPVQFDVIVFTEVLEHLNFHPKSSLEKIRGLLAPGGRLFLSTPDAKEWGRVTKYYARLADIPPVDRTKPMVDDHVWQYTQEELAAVVRESGFQVERSAYAPGFPNRHFNLQLKSVPHAAQPADAQFRGA